MMCKSSPLPGIERCNETSLAAQSCQKKDRREMTRSSLGRRGKERREEAAKKPIIQSFFSLLPINITDDIFTFRIRSRAVQVFDVVIIKCQTILKRKKKLLLQSRLKPAPFFVCNPFKCRLARFVWNK